MGILFVPMFLAGIVMMFKNPEPLKKRLDAKEEQKEQCHIASQISLDTVHLVISKSPML